MLNADRITLIHNLFNELQRELHSFTTDAKDLVFDEATLEVDRLHHDVQLAIDALIEANDLVQTVAGNYRARAPITD